LEWVLSHSPARTSIVLPGAKEICMLNQPESTGISLQGFTSTSHGGEFPSFLSALESFDQLEQLQELKALGHQRIGIAPGAHVLDVGCGFGLETLRLARLASPGGSVAGCDLSTDFLAEARRRADAASLEIAFEHARAEALPYPDGSFDIVWSERLLIYVPDVPQALSEMKRVLRRGGRVALIEPDISTSTLNFSDRGLVRRVMGHEADANVAHGWLPGQLRSTLESVGFQDVSLATRVVVFAPGLAAGYFTQCGHSAAAAGTISSAELQRWTSGIQELLHAGNLFATVGYFLFTAETGLPRVR
jgi:SAM-dependent methyltransferase